MTRLRAVLPLFLAACLQAQWAPGSPEARLSAEILEKGHAMADLEVLSDDIGPRLTGSANLRRADAWMQEKLKAYGAVNVHEEAYDFAPAWTRGESSARLLTHSGMRLKVEAMAWNPSTPGTIRGEVALFAGKADALEAKVKELKGKILLLGPIHPTAPEGQQRAQLERLYRAAQEAGAQALLFGSTHKDGKLTMLGSPFEAYFRDFLPPWPRLPFGFLQPEHQAMLRRLLARGERVELELNLAGSVSGNPVKAYNVVGELRGSEKPDEVVLIGGHLDSWDLGTGTTDNGTGVIAALETLRAMQAAGLKPKRTIRVVLFSGEEQGLCGSEAYVKAHEGELSKIQAVLIDDFGGGKATGFLMQQREDLLPFMAKVIEPLASLGVKNLPLTREDDSDHTPFVRKGVPAFFLEQESSEYFASTHHSQVDTFDHVKKDDYLQGVQALALTAWRLANLDARLPHRMPRP